MLNAPRSSLTTFDIALYVFLIFAWGTSWLPLRYQIGVVSPEVSLFWRFALATPIVFLIAGGRGENLRFPARTHLDFVLFGVLLFALSSAIFYYGNFYLTSGLLAVISSLTPMINVVLGAAFMRAPVD
ncbi:MAG: EamA family transporter, partial [Pseudorhodoplanes sp.]